MRFQFALLAAALLLPQVPVQAQEKRDSGALPTYKVEFLIRDGGDPATKATRRYTLLMDQGRKSVLKMGNRLPVSTGSFLPNSPGASPITQYTYLDVGASIECSINETNGRIEMHGNLDLSSVMQHDAAPRANPTLAQTRLDLSTVVELGKPTVIAAIDDPAGARQFQVEATVTRIN